MSAKVDRLREQFLSSSVGKRVLAVYKKYGWKAVLGLFGYYLIRDVTLYVIIPYYAFALAR